VCDSVRWASRGRMREQCQRRRRICATGTDYPGSFGAPVAGVGAGRAGGGGSGGGLVQRFAQALLRRLLKEFFWGGGRHEARV
jgi:hypothetical protein